MVQNLVFAQKTDRGLQRATNEDACGYRIPEPGTPAAGLGAMFIVADGIGGIGNGEEASQAAVETILKTYYAPELDDDNPRERVLAAIQAANTAVRAKAKALAVDMLGTTLAGVVLVAPETALLFNVGDSRIYLLRDKHIQQVTADHSSIDETESYAKAKLTAFIGQIQPILPHMVMQELRRYDTLLICSDGLWGLVEPHEIAEVVQRNTPQKAVELLVEKVYARGARDNVTITIIQNGKRRDYMTMTFVLLLLIVIIGFFALLKPMPVTTVNTDTMTLNVPPTATHEPGLSVKTPFSATNAPEDDGENHGQLIIRTPTMRPVTDKETK